MRTPPIQMGSRSKQQTGLQTRPVKSYWQIPVGNQGIYQVCSNIYKTLKARDSKTEVTLDQFMYVTCLAYWNRLNQVAINTGYSTPLEDSYQLDITLRSVKLPRLIISMLSSIGVVETPNGAQVVPYIPGEFSPIYTHPVDFWISAHPEEDIPDNFWCLDATWISEWNNGILRSSRFDFGFQNLDSTNPAGRLEMLVSLLPTNGVVQLDYSGVHIVGVAPLKMLDAESIEGAVFNFRNYLEYTDWPAASHAELVFGIEHSSQFDPTTKINEMILSTIKFDNTPSF